MKSILVLGSEGQIGSALCKELEKEYIVKCMDIVLDTDHDLARDFSDPYNDESTDTLTNYLNEVDYVFFLAFDVGGSVYLKKYQDTYEFIHNNISMMKNVFEKLECHGIPFLFASSQMSNMTHSTYGLLKAVGEKYTKSLTGDGYFETSTTTRFEDRDQGKVVHFWNVYGEEQDLEKSHVITDFVRMAQSGSIQMRTTGEEKRQFLHAEDCSKGLIEMMKRHDQLPFVTHLTSFEWTSVKHIATMVAHIAHLYEPHKDLPEVIPGTATDDVQQMIVNDPDESILQFWKPEVNLVEGITRITDFERKRL